jgi:hypothetical protein
MNEARKHTDNRAEAVPSEVAEIDREIARLKAESRPLRLKVIALRAKAMMRRDRAEKAGNFQLLDFVYRHGHYPDGFNYFISDGEFVKIGYSARPKDRLNTLQGQIGRELRILAQYPGTIWTEHQLHSEFRTLRVHGEWFRPDDRLLGVIEAVKGGALMADALAQSR